MKSILLPIILMALSYAQTTDQIKMAKDAAKKGGMSESQIIDAAKSQGYTDKQIEMIKKKEKSNRQDKSNQINSEYIDESYIPSIGESNQVIQGLNENNINGTKNLVDESISEIEDEFAGVTVPFFLKAGFKYGILSGRAF